MHNLDRVLFIGAHFDDVDLACLGTMAKLVKNKVQVYKLTLTDNITITSDFTVDYQTSKLSSEKICKAIGVEQVNFDEFPCSNLECGQVQMQSIEAVIDELNPQMVITHHPQDMNLDHVAASRLVTTASRHVKSVAYFKSNMYFNSDFKGNLFFDISEFSELKKELLHIYAREHDRKNRLFDHAINRDKLNSDFFNVSAIESYEALRLYFE